MPRADASVPRLGIDLGGSKIEIVALDPGGRELLRRRVPTPRDDTRPRWRLAFGGVPSGSGQTRSRSMTITNLGGTQSTFTVAISGQPGGVAYSVSPTTVALDAGASATVTVSARATVGAGGPQQAFLEVKQGDTSVGHAALFTLMK